MGKWTNWNTIEDEFTKYSHIKTRLILGKSSQQVRFSIVIPMYKRYDYLNEALESAIHQDIDEPYEIAIFDNEFNASDKKLEIIQHLADSNDNFVYYQNEENLGMFGNFNRAISMARGQWVVVLHDDDLLKPNYLSTMLKLIAPDVAMISPHPEILDMRVNLNKKKNSKLAGVMKYFKGLKPVYLSDYLHISGVSPICALLNKNMFLKAGGYYESQFPSSDMGGVMRLATMYKIYYYPEKLFYYRYDVNESLNEKTSREFIDDTYDITYELGKYLNLNDQIIKKICSQNVATSISYSLLPDKNLLFEEYFKKFNIDQKYRKPFYLKYLHLKNGLHVFIRLLRKRK